tara:strand:- start:10 stop:1650 length:1641 start_codon:yes stop_codon:yes gene_type:complete
MATYSEIFQLQSKYIKNKQSKIWKKIDRKIHNLKNRSLLGTILAERYLHPTGWRSTYKELKDWMSNYHDHPDAYRIYRLAKRRKPKNYKFPQKPSGNFLNGYGNISQNLIKPTFPLIRSGHKYPRFSFLTSVKVRRAINRKQTKYIETLLSSKKVKQRLRKIEIAQLRAELAHGFFIFKDDRNSIRQARVSISLSGGENALAYWAGGLASWRSGFYTEAKRFFEKLSAMKKGPESILSGGSFWAAKSAFQVGEIKKINKFLVKAASYDRTFYSLLASAALGYNKEFNFDLPKIKISFYQKLMSMKAGKRILVLLQLNQNHKASREFRKIIFKFDKKEYPMIVSFASKYNMPGLAFRVSAILRNDYGKIMLGGLYPIPKWETSKLEIDDKALILSISRQESGFNPMAKSSANALGLMQVLPSTAAFIMRDKTYKYRVKKNLLFNEEKNILIGTKYMRFLLNLDLVNSDVVKMLASYNAGPGNLNKWMKKIKPKDRDPILLIESLPARQTRNYIKLVLTNLNIYRSRFNETSYVMNTLASGSSVYYKE